MNTLSLIYKKRVCGSIGLVVIILAIIAGCSYFQKPKSPQIVTILESEFLPVIVDVNGIPFDKMSIIDLIAMEDWNDVTITPIRKGIENSPLTHYLITPRAIEKLRPKVE